MKRTDVVIDDDDDEKDRRFMVNAISEPTLGMHDDIDVPIICLDDEDDDDNGAGDLKIDRDYKVFLDELSSCDGILGPLFEVNNGKSDIRKFDESKPVDRVYQDRKRKTFRIKTENSRDMTLAAIQRDNRAAERRKRRLVGLETTRTSRVVPLRKTQQRDNRVERSSEIKAETSSRAETLSRSVPLVSIREDIERDDLTADQREREIVELEATRTLRTVPVVRTQEDIERDNIAVGQRKRKIVELETTRTSRTVPSVRTQEDIERENIAVEQRKQRTMAAKTSRAVPLVRIQDNVERDNIDVEQRKRRIVKLEATRTSKTVPLVTTQEDIERDNLAAEQRKQRIVELEARRSSRAVPKLKTQQRDNRARECLELQAETLSRGLSLVRIQGENRAAERIKRQNSESIAAETCTVTQVEQVNRVTVVVDNDYKCYLEWLVDSLKDSIAKPKANVPDPDAIKESTVALDEDQLVEVKVERDVESWSDDSDIIAMSDSPFMDGEDTLFVTSKKVVDLDGGSKEVESSSRCRFKKELMNVLEKPYNEGELRQLHHEASIHRKMTRSRELRKGRATDYETNELGKSYLEKFTDFENEYKAVNGVDKVRALKLLRGFFFYLKHVSHDGVFKPWVKDQWWQP